MTTNLKCTHCGANLMPQDLERPHCPYCRNVLPHHAMAQQQVQVVREMMADRNGNGIPDAYEGFVQNAMNPYFGGGPPQPPGPPVGAPPVAGNPYGAYGAPPPTYGVNYAYDVQNQVAKSVGRSLMISLIMSVVMIVVIGGIVVAAFVVSM